MNERDERIERYRLAGERERLERERLGQCPVNYANQEAPIPKPERRKTKEVAPEVLVEIRRQGRGPSPGPTNPPPGNNT
jgi:hypothetical protein